MAFGAIEVFAFIIAAFALIKMLIVWTKPKSWINFAKGLWKKPALTGLISLVLAAIVLYYLLAELTIVQIFAVMLFLTLLFAMGMAPFAKDFLSLGRKLTKRKIRDSWLYMLVWLALIVWMLWTLFG